MYRVGSEGVIHTLSVIQTNHVSRDTRRMRAHRSKHASRHASIPIADHHEAAE